MALNEHAQWVEDVKGPASRVLKINQTSHALEVYESDGSTLLTTVAGGSSSSVSDVDSFGAVGDGTSRPLSTVYGTLVEAQAVYPHAVALTDELDWAALQAAADWCKANGGTLSSSKQDLVINRTVDCVGVRSIDLRSTVTCYQTTEPGLLIGGASTNRIPIQAYLHWVRHDTTPRLGNRDNPTVRVVGAKNAQVQVGWADYFQLWADSASALTDSVAYSKFHIGYSEFLELLGVGAGWITENTFDLGDVTRIDIIGDTFKHNHNLFRDPTLEGSTVNIEHANSNLFTGVRAESGLTANFDAGSDRNYVEIDWYQNPIAVDGVDSANTINDLSGLNGVYHTHFTHAHQFSLLRVDRNTATTDVGSSLPGAQASIQPGLDLVQIPSANVIYADTGRLRVRSDMEPLLGHESRLIDYMFTSDKSAWRVRAYVYDAAGAVLDGAATDYVAPISGLAWNTNGYYGFSADIAFSRIHVQHADVEFIRFELWGGSGAAGTVFEYAEFTAFLEAPNTPGLVDEYAKQLRPRPITATAAPTKLLLDAGEEFTVAGLKMRVAVRVDTALTAAATSGATTVDVEDAGSAQSGDLVAVRMSDRSTHFTTVANVAGNTITLDTGLTASGLIGGEVVVTRTESADASGAISPAAYGATSGATDNETAINAALAASAGSGLPVVLDADYQVSGRVDVIANTILEGPGSIIATWSDQGSGPNTVVYQTGANSVTRNLTVRGAHDGSPTAAAGDNGVTGLLVQNATDFVVDRVTSEYHSQMGFRVFASSRGKIIHPVARFTGRDGLTLMGEGAMSDIVIDSPFIYQTGDDGIAVWDGTVGGTPGTTTTGSITAGARTLVLPSTAGLSAGDPVVVAGAYYGTAPLHATVESVTNGTDVVLSSAATITVVSAVTITGFARPTRITISDAIVCQSTPVHAAHANRNGRGIIIAGADDVKLINPSVHRTVALGLVVENGQMTAGQTLMWSSNVTVDNPTVTEANRDAPTQPTTNASAVVREAFNVQVNRPSIRDGFGSGMVVRDLVNAKFSGGDYSRNRVNGFTVQSAFINNQVVLGGATFEHNQGAGVEDTGAHLVARDLLIRNNGVASTVVQESAAGGAMVHYGHNSGVAATFVANDRVLFTELNANGNGVGNISLNAGTDIVTLAADTGLYEVSVFADTEAPASGDAVTCSVLIGGVAFSFFDVNETSNQVGSWCDIIDTAGAAATVEVNRASVTGSGRLNVKAKIVALG